MNPSPARQAVVLVGGRGTRLGDLVKETPKPLLPVTAERRFIDYLLENLARHGFQETILLAGHLGEQVEQAYHDRRVNGMALRVIREPAPAGTAGALTYASDWLAAKFLMMNGDSYFDFNYLALTGVGKAGMLGALALRWVPDAGRYGAVTLDGDQITRFSEKDPAAGQGLISGGVYALDRGVMSLIDTLPCSIETDIFPRLAAGRQLLGIPFPGYFIDIGLPETLLQCRAELERITTRPAVIFDRDGCLIYDDGYTYKIEDLRWMPGAIDAVRYVNDNGGLAIVATNQSGIGRGYYTEADMRRFHAQMQTELAELGAHIDAFYFCPFHADASLERYRATDHFDRKPNPGMILRALSDWPVDPGRTLLVGDKDSDLAAATAAGIRGALSGSQPLDQLVRAAWDKDGDPTDTGQGLDANLRS